jgi:sugar O-acyltransferase (sialic acid O-acetyltransferase NeuD family)
MRDIVIFGAGGFGREVALMIREINQHQQTWNLLGFYDDGKKKGDVIDGFTVLGNLADLKARKSSASVVIGIADPHIRKALVDSLDHEGIDFPVIIHPSVLPGDTRVNRFGRGTIVTAGCILTTAITLGDFVILNLATTIGHDVNVGNFSSLMPGCRISGFVEIGDCVYLGSGAVVLPQVKLGGDCIVGAGAVVTRSVEAATTVVGIPATAR